MKKNRRNNNNTNGSNHTNIEGPDSPGSNSSRGTIRSNSKPNSKSKTMYDKFDDIGTNNNSASSDCGTPVSSPLVKDPYEFRIKTEDNDSDSVSEKMLADSKKGRNEPATPSQPKKTSNECDSGEGHENHNQQSTQQDSCHTPLATSKIHTPKLSSSSSKSKRDRKKSIGINTSPEKQTYPPDEKACAPGTVIQLSGTVWLETNAGMLIINVTWRGRSYIGSLLDTSQHKFSPPIPQEYQQPSSQTNNNQNSHYNSPAKYKHKKRSSFNIPHRLPVGRPSGKRKSHVKNPSAKNMRTNHTRLVSESSSSIDDGSSLDENLKEERLTCPISDCDKKFISFNAMREHLAEHNHLMDDSSKASNSANINSGDDTLINVETNCSESRTSNPPPPPPPSITEQGNEVRVNDLAILPPRSASVLPSSKHPFPLNNNDKRSETRTPSPPRLALAHSPQPSQHNHLHMATINHASNNKHPFNISLDNLYKKNDSHHPHQNKKQKLDIDHHHILHAGLTTMGLMKKTDKDHEENLKLLKGAPHFNSPLPPITSSHQMQLHHLQQGLNSKFLNNMTNNANNRKESPPKLLPEVNVNSSLQHPHDSFGLHHNQLKASPFLANPNNRPDIYGAHLDNSPSNNPIPLNLMNNNNNNNGPPVQPVNKKSLPSASDNHSINNFFSESLMAAASGKLHHPSAHQSLTSSASTGSLMSQSNPSSLTHHQQQQSTDLLAAVAKMLGANSGATSSILNSSNTHNNLSMSSQAKINPILPTTIGGPSSSSSSSNSGGPQLNMSQFDTKSLSSAAYLMNLPGLLSSTNHQMR